MVATFNFSVHNFIFQASGSFPLLNYLRHLFVLCYNILFYLSQPENFVHGLAPVFLVAPVIIAGLVILIVRTKTRTNKLILDALFFIIAILPVSQIIPLNAPAIAADRYTYIPAVGLFFAGGIIYLWLYNKAPSSVRIILAVFLLDAFLSFNHRKVWKDIITLWDEVAYFNPKNYNLALQNYTNAIAVDTLNVDAYYNRAITLTKLGNLEMALNDYNQVLKLNPDYVHAYYNRATAYYISGNFSKAREDVKKLKQLGVIPDSNLLKLLK